MGNEITKLYVAPCFIRRGIGSALLGAAEKAIARAGHSEIVLGTVFDSSIAFYEAMGMSKAGRKSVICGPLEGADSTIMKKLLPSQRAPATGLPAGPGLGFREGD
jgi:ribosomal protein S18 acetylase RimI-like enzyme